MRPFSVPFLAVMLSLAGGYPALAGQVTCNDEVVRLSRALSYNMLSPEATKQAQERLLKELESCEPVFSNPVGKGGGSPQETAKPRSLERKGPKPPTPPTPPKRSRNDRVGSSTPPASEPRPDMVTPDPVPTDLERQSLRGYQGTLSPSELREGDRRLDAIQRQATTNPSQAKSMMQIFQQDRALSTVNRPVGNIAPPPLGTPSLLGPTGNIGTRR